MPKKSNHGRPTDKRSPLTASTMSGHTVPSSTAKANTAKNKLLNRNAPSRDSGESMRPGERSRSPRQPMSPIVTSTMSAKNVSTQTPMPDSVNACTESSTPERVRNVPRIVSANVAHSNVRFQTRNIPRRSCTITECRYAVPVSHGRNDAFSTGSHAQAPPQPRTS